jgi:hypothetical protein
MIEDILNAPLEELEDEIREKGEDPNTIADTLRARLSRAQEQVIDAKLAAANAIPRKAKSPPLPGASSSTLPSARSEIATVTPLTLAARNAQRPFGFDDPSIDDDLRELRSETWDDD